METKVYRAWINQPSKLQPLHKLHPSRCICIDDGGVTVRLYFTDGPVSSMEAPRHCISKLLNQ